MNESELRAALAEAERQRDEARANERAARKLLAEPTLNARTLSENVRLMRKLGAAEAALADAHDALRQALDLAAEGWAYAGDYFRHKWDFAGHYERLNSLLAAVPPQHPQPSARCEQCHGVGWVIDARLDREPLTAELIECPLPGCIYAGRRLEHLSFKGAGFTRSFEHNGVVMAVGR